MSNNSVEETETKSLLKNVYVQVRPPDATRQKVLNHVLHVASEKATIERSLNSFRPLLLPGLVGLVAIVLIASGIATAPGF
jgi:hypothetical protein